MNKNNHSTVTRTLFLAACCFAWTLCVVWTLSVYAAQAPEPKEPAASYTERGADTCLKCHDEDSKFPVLSIFKTKHAQFADRRTPFAKLQCESCHGPGAQHAIEVPEGQKQAPILKFGVTSQVPLEKRNEICLGCHQNEARVAWQGSPHANNNVACASCHKIHATHDAVLAIREQPPVCLNCHKRERAEFDKPSVHPVRFGQMGCNSCHQVHGAIGFTYEHILHRYYKRAQWLEAFAGYGRVHRAAVAAAILDGEAA